MLITYAYNQYWWSLTQVSEEEIEGSLCPVEHVCSLPALVDFGAGIRGGGSKLTIPCFSHAHHLCWITGTGIRGRDGKLMV